MGLSFMMQKKMHQTDFKGRKTVTPSNIEFQMRESHSRFDQ